MKRVRGYINRKDMVISFDTDRERFMPYRVVINYNGKKAETYFNTCKALFEFLTILYYLMYPDSSECKRELNEQKEN